MGLTSLIAKEFRLNDDIIYLNHAAVSPWPSRTVEAVRQFAEENARLGAKNYAQWTKTETVLRRQLQWLLNAPSVSDIGLLKNTSEALSVVAEGIIWRSGDNIVSSNEEFPSNRIPWLAQAHKGVNLREIDISSESPEQDLIDACDENTRLLTVSSIQYGSGRRLDLKQLGDFCSKNNILFCVDAIQSLGVLPMDVQAINADFVMADAHKWLLGPEGIALFYCSEKVRESLSLHQFGWHMVEDLGNYDNKDWIAANSARRFECGSPNMLGIHALSASLSIFEEVGLEETAKIIINNSLYIIDYINNLKDFELCSPCSENRLGGIVTFKLKYDDDNLNLYNKLLKHNVICANRMRGIRFSPHFYTARNKIDKALEILSSIT